MFSNIFEKALSDREKRTALENFYHYNRYGFNSYERALLVAKIKGLSEAKRHLKSKKKSTCGFSELTRYHMLAYAFLRKMPYKVVEKNCGEYNKPSDKILARIVQQCVSPVYGHNTTAMEYCSDAVKEWLNATG